MKSNGFTISPNSVTIDMITANQGRIVLERPTTLLKSDTSQNSSTWADVDISALTTIPTNARAVIMEMVVNDAGSAANTCEVRLRKKGETDADQRCNVGCNGIANDKQSFGLVIVEMDSADTIQREYVASGAGTLDVYWKLWGWVLWST